MWISASRIDLRAKFSMSCQAALLLGGTFFPVIRQPAKMELSFEYAQIKRMPGWARSRLENLERPALLVF
jgi:hypothetical protein